MLWKHKSHSPSPKTRSHKSHLNLQRNPRLSQSKTKKRPSSKKLNQSTTSEINTPQPNRNKPSRKPNPTSTSSRKWAPCHPCKALAKTSSPTNSKSCKHSTPTWKISVIKRWRKTPTPTCSVGRCKPLIGKRKPIIHLHNSSHNITHRKMSSPKRSCSNAQPTMWPSPTTSTSRTWRKKEAWSETKSTPPTMPRSWRKAGRWNDFIEVFNLFYFCFYFIVLF